MLAAAQDDPELRDLKAAYLMKCTEPVWHGAAGGHFCCEPSTGLWRRVDPAEAREALKTSKFGMYVCDGCSTMRTSYFFYKVRSPYDSNLTYQVQVQVQVSCPRKMH